jgi:acyl dehydratase
VTTTTVQQRTWEQIAVGDELTSASYPLSIYRLVVAAGGNRDFNSIHHNRDYARSSGAPDSYASTFFLMGTWERVVRDFIGSAGTIRSIENFRMRKFNLVGSVMEVTGRVLDKSIESDGGPAGIVGLEILCRVGDEITVGPGRVVVTLPRAGESA